MNQGDYFQQMLLEQLDIHIQKKTNLDKDLTPFPKLTQWIINLYVKHKTIKV